MTKYALMYRLGITPWEGYGTAASASIATLLDREQDERSHPLGWALDLGCGRGQYTLELARRGWQAVGIDNAARAIQAAQRKRTAGATYVVGDVTDLSGANLGTGTFDFFLDVGCFQGLNARQRALEAHGITTLATPDATILLLAFGPSWMRSLLEGVSPAAVEAAFSGWQMLAVQPADTRGLGWPMNTTRPRWYRLRRRRDFPAPRETTPQHTLGSHPRRLGPQGSGACGTTEVGRRLRPGLGA